MQGLICWLQAHGVYEGTYWELLANIGELTEALTQMAVGPAVLEEPVLKLPAAPTLPSWETYKPVLQPLPHLPQVCITLCHAELCCAASCCAVPCHAVLCHAVLCCAALRCAMLCCLELYLAESVVAHNAVRLCWVVLCPVVPSHVGLLYMQFGNTSLVCRACACSSWMLQSSCLRSSLPKWQQ